ncbi:MAG: nucleotide sugar dehydrogenase [Candidatus Ranarchaeia archaeon]
MRKEIKHILVKEKTSIRQTMEIIDRAPHKGAPAGIALIVDDERKLIGVVTDGDIRRAALRNVDLNSPVGNIAIRDPVTVEKGLSSSEMIDVVLKKVRESPRLKGAKIDKVIVVDEKGRVDDVVSFFEIWRKSEIKTREVCIVGLGYVGLTLAASLADVGLRIIGVDHNRKILETLKRGIPTIHERGLDTLLRYHLNKTFFLKSDLKKSESDVYIVCVETPVDDRKKPVLDYLEKAATSVGRVLKKDDLVILRSTVPVGSCRRFVIPILERESGLVAGEEFYLAFAPERTIEGRALEELRKLPQIIGGLNKTSTELAAKLFRELAPAIVTVESLEAAEMAKLINNTFRDLTFAYANEIAVMCDRLGLDAARLIEAANEGYPRGNVPMPSPGVGGACLTKDPYILIDASRKVGYEPKLVREARKINEQMPLLVAEKILRFCNSKGKKLSAVKIFIIGFAFKGKPETADMRFSPTLDLLEALRKAGIRRIYGYDPVVPSREIKKLRVMACSLKQGFKNADCAVIMNDHESYAHIAILPLLNSMKRPGLFFDGWHIFSKEMVAQVTNVSYETFGV